MNTRRSDARLYLGLAAVLAVIAFTVGDALARDRPSICETVPGSCRNF